MTPKQRVHAALRREPADRVPVFMWFHPETARHLAERAGDSRRCRRRGDGRRRAHDLGEQQLRHGRHRPRERRGRARRSLGRALGEGGRVQPASAFPLAGALARRCSRTGFPRTAGLPPAPDGPACWPQKEKYFIGCDVSRASSRCTGGCAAWRTPSWTWPAIPSSPARCSAGARGFAVELSRRACAELPAGLAVVRATTWPASPP